MAKINNTYQQRFEKTLSKLNAAQKTAVAQTEGPVMVIAGPGTGKTHILASRIGNIRLQTDAHASNILCLTFTEAGAVAMRKRLLELIGPEAHKVHIFTFHGFCNHIIKNHNDLFGSQGIELLSDLERIELLRMMIDQLPATSILKNIHDPYYYEPHLSRLFKTIKTEDWSQKQINDAIDTYIASLEHRPEFLYARGTLKGKLKEGQYAEEVARMEKLRQAAMLYPDYQQHLQRLKRYDFDDMILWVIGAFAKNENLLRNYQEQYLYFLVDEYQDTNGAQNKLLQQLIAYWDLPNVFIVGDDDQAIYEFQGARLQSLKDLYLSYQNEISIVVLKDNYRSTQGILDAARALIDINENRIINTLKNLGVNKNLSAAVPKLKKDKTKPAIVAYPNLLHECADVVHKIEQLITNGVAPTEIAVIYAKNKQASPIMKLMDKKGIAYTSKRPINILQEKTIRQVLAVLSYALEESTVPYSGEHQLFEILHFPEWSLDIKDIAHLALHLRKKNHNTENPIFWRQAIRDASELNEAGITNTASFFSASEIIESLIENVKRDKLEQLYEKVINQCGFLQSAIASDDSINEIQMLHTLFAYIQSEQQKNHQYGLKDLMFTLKMMETHRLSLAMQKTISVGNGVLLTTAHSAKGLEFEYVFMIDCAEEMWKDNGRTANFSFKLPDTLTLTQIEEGGEEARRRLFYVAMTRAKTHLQISYNGDKPTKFIEELEAAAAINIQQKNTEENIVKAASITLLGSQNKAILLQNKGFLEERLQSFSLSPSSFNRFLDCPLSFYYEHLLRVPSAHSDYFTYGNAMHYAMEHFARQFRRTLRKPTMEDTTRYFEKYMQTHAFRFTTKRYEQLVEIGKARLEAYYEKQMVHWGVEAEVEKQLNNTTIGAIPVQGNIDRISYLSNGNVEITDFKTGKVKKEYLEPLSDKKPLGGSYRRQLIFYKLLFEQHRDGGLPVQKVHLSYLEQDASGDFPMKSFDFSAEELDRFTTLLEDTYQKIMNQEFQEGCGKKTCKWCNFVSEHITSSSFVNIAIEELDDDAM